MRGLPPAFTLRFPVNRRDSSVTRIFRDRKVDVDVPLQRHLLGICLRIGISPLAPKYYAPALCLDMGKVFAEVFFLPGYGSCNCSTGHDDSHVYLRDVPGFVQHQIKICIVAPSGFFRISWCRTFRCFGGKKNVNSRILNGTFPVHVDRKSNSADELAFTRLHHAGLPDLEFECPVGVRFRRHLDIVRLTQAEETTDDER